MRVSVTQELLIFLYMIALGAAEGLIFDLFRTIRKNIATSFAAVGVSDAVYWIFAAFVFGAVVMNITNGALRGYMFIGIALGLIFYFFLFSRVVIFALMTIISFILKFFKLFLKILLTPVKFLYKMLVNPFIGFIKVIYAKNRFAGFKFKKFFPVRKQRQKNDKKKK